MCFSISSLSIVTLPQCLYKRFSKSSTVSIVYSYGADILWLCTVTIISSPSISRYDTRWDKIENL